MALAGHANLFHGGGGMQPYPKRREDMFNPEKKQGPNMSGFGSKPTYEFIPKLDGTMYPTPDIPKDQPWPSTLECAKGGGTVSLSREINIKEPEYTHFRMAGDTHESESWRWFLEHMDKIVPDFCLNFVFVPMCIEGTHIYIRTCVPLPGLTFDIIEFYTETVIEAGVDWGAPVQEVVDNCLTYCRRFEIPEELQFSEDCNRLFGIKLVSIPDKNEDNCKPGCGLLDGFSIDFSVQAFCPWSGE